ncbi:MAG: serine/threonine protein kinase, partial [Blastocatellia bacterium]
TLEYLSPELLNGGLANPKSDIWALGVLLYEMVTGTAPFESPTLPGLFDKIMRGEFAPASSLNPSVSPELERIISKCLKKKAADRYQSVEEMAADMDRFAASVSSPRLSTHDLASSQAPNWLKSKQAVIAAALAGIVLIIVLMILMLGGDNSGQTGGSGDSSTIRPVEVAIMDGTADVYDDHGTFKSRTPYRFDAKLGSDVKLVLKRQGYQDKIIEFKVGEENTYDGYQMEPVQK